MRSHAASVLRSLANRLAPEQPRVLVGRRGHCPDCRFDWVGGHICMAPYQATGA